MCAGVPIVASAEIGCAADLFQSGVNEQTFGAGDVEGLASALQPILASREIGWRMGQASRKIISGATLSARAVCGLHSAAAEWRGVSIESACLANANDKI
jgi:hypothetical protein